MNRIEKAHCNNCLGERNHEILFERAKKETDYTSEGNEIWWTESYQMIECLGCNNISLRHYHYFSEMYDGSGNLIPEIKYYPPAISRPLPKWIKELDAVKNKEETIIYELMNEIYTALYSDSLRIATMGLRALVEHVMIMKVGDNQNFTENLKKFCSEGYISDKQKKLIEAVLEMGHATMHRGYKPNPDDLITVLNITESVIETVCIHSKNVNILSTKIPKRKP